MQKFFHFNFIYYLYCIQIKNDQKMKKAKLPVHGSTQTMIAPSPKKLKKFMVETKEYGLGFILPHEPKVFVKQGQIIREKIVVHLVKENLEPRLFKNGKPKMILMASDNYTVLKPIEPPKAERRAKRADGEPAPPKDFTQYKFDGKTMGKGKLVLAIVQKFVADNEPNFVELRRAFPEHEVRAYKGLFVTLDEATKINEANNKRSRFYTANDEVIKLKGNAKIAVTNQVTADLVNRMLPIAARLGYTIVATSEPVAKPEKVKAPKAVKMPKTVKAKPAKKAKVKKVKKIDLLKLTAKEIIAHVEKVAGVKIEMSLKNKQAIVKKAQTILKY